MKLVSCAQMRSAEAAAIARGVEGFELMRNASRALADAVQRLSGRQRPPVLVLVGPGNNGGDGLVAAHYLRRRGYPVNCYLWRRQRDPDRPLAMAEQTGALIYRAQQDPDRQQLATLASQACVIVDALLGIGARAALDPELAGLLNSVKRAASGAAVLAVDLPTGVDADSGKAAAETLPATLTVTFGHAKAGLVQAPGAALAGRVEVADIGLRPEDTADYLANLLTAEASAPLLPRRQPYSHKGTHGKALIIAGSHTYSGAPNLAALAALRSGAGLVNLLAPASVHAASRSLWELTHTPLDGNARYLSEEHLEAAVAAQAGAGSCLCGPGIGREPATSAFVLGWLRQLHRSEHVPSTTILDADALYALSMTATHWWHWLPQGTVLTPHAGEMARLLGNDAGTVEHDRLQLAALHAARWGVTLVLKSAYTVVASPSGDLWLSLATTPALAAGGSGDVLAGAIAGLAAQGVPALSAALLAVYALGQAGRQLEHELGSRGSLASEVANRLPLVLAELDSLRENRLLYDIGNSTPASVNC